MPELARSDKIVQSVIGESFSYKEAGMVPEVDMRLDQDILRNDAIRMALLNNKSLLATIQELGIAKADLVQAGLLKNPKLSTAFHIPPPGLGIVTNVEVETTILSLSDLWQIPLRRQVFSRQLERTIMKLVERTLETMVAARQGYDAILFSLALVTNAEETLTQAIRYRDNTKHRYNFGLVHSGDIYLAEAAVGHWHTIVLEERAHLFSAQKHLAQVMGIDPIHATICPNPNEFSLTTLPALPLRSDLLEWAVNNNPRLQVARKKISYYQALLAYEHTRRVKTADFGLAYKQDFDLSNKGIGPYFEIEVPFFDTNQVRIAHVEYSLKQAQLEECDLCLQVKADIVSLYNTHAMLYAAYQSYEQEILPHHKKALEFATRYQKVMQVTVSTVIQMQKDLYTAQKNFYEIIFKMLNTYTELEKAVGKNLDHFIC